MGIFIKSGILHTLKFDLHTLSCHFWLNLCSKHITSCKQINVKLFSSESHRTPLRSQNWFRSWLGVIRQHSITWANVHWDPCQHTWIAISINFYLPASQNNIFLNRLKFRRKLCLNPLARLTIIFMWSGQSVMLSHMASLGHNGSVWTNRNILFHQLYFRMIYCPQVGTWSWNHANTSQDRADISLMLAASGRCWLSSRVGVTKSISSAPLFSWFYR